MSRSQSSTGVCCLQLLAALGTHVSFPESQNYTSSLSSYFSQQQVQLQPSCVVSPFAVEDVSTAIRILSTSNCRFAVRSGGHGTVTGSSNIAEGVTLDLRGLNSIVVNGDKSTVSVGPGATWGAVYGALDPLNLTVAGGRVSGVGVGGLATGGGISFFSPRYGFTCDTATNYQVVLADGSVTNANAEINKDLLFALRGGSNNFGVVTRIDFNSIKQGHFWGGSIVYNISTAPAQLKALSDFSQPDSYDEYASLILSLAYAASIGQPVISNVVDYTKAEVNPPVFQPLLQIPSLQSTTRISNMSDFAQEASSKNPDGIREHYSMITHGSSPEMLNASYENWERSLPSIQNVTNIVWALSFDPLPPAIYDRAAPGSSAMGLSGTRNGSLIIAQLSASWTDPADDNIVDQAAQLLMSGIESDARRLREYDPFLYINYAAKWQNPIASYGPRSVRKLKEVSNKLDPGQVFQKAVPGGFKLP